ncbi:hypothetical protein INQ51_01810 [Maribellus sp. CM-23]|uniref:hypothetical protein n=1 Tax=Maribellus sp. CM-23 TaxID=2781026 RepID=UPI001F46278F|nr:hypothetical protein [Maribellus sp. CM-23]MCE4563035.1 hypothetical protein [Maribellus sp. CM-23]
MSFGGSVLAMIQSLRANARPKHKAYQDWTKTENRRYSSSPQVFFKKVSAEKLAEIKAKNREETEREQRRSYWKITLSLLVIVPVVTLFLFEFFFQPDRINRNPARSKTVEATLSAEQIDYLLNSGYSWLNKNHYKNARFQFERVLEVQPRNKIAVYGMAASFVYECKKERQKCDEAQKRLDEYIRKYGEDSTTDYLKLMLGN